MAIPKRVKARIVAGLKRFHSVLDASRRADRSEQDTVTIVTDLLADVFGYNKYIELTGEYAIRGTYCDLAIVVDGKVRFLVEVKAIDKTLKSHHVRQATDYAAKEGITWVVLTNGIDWQVYRMEFDQPVRSELSYCFNMLTPDRDIAEKIYALSREGISKQAMRAYHEELQATNRYIVAAVLLTEPVLKAVRRELRGITPGVRVDLPDIEEVLTAEVIKRDVVEGEDIEAARREVKKRARKSARSSKPARKKHAAKTPNAASDVT